MIYCIGNSHAWIFTGDSDDFPPQKSVIPLFKVEYIGPTIAYNFFEHHLPKILSLLANVDKEKDAIMLIIGEVDCRWHLPYQANLQKRNLEEVVIECVDRFFRSLLLLKKQGYKVYGWACHPTTTQGHTEGEGPVYGDVATRNNACLIWNKHLKKLCGENDISFFSIYEKLVDENNITKMEYFRDYCHLNNNVLPFILEIFKE